MSSPTDRPIAIVTGCGGMGLAIARRVSPGRLLFLGDISPTALETAKSSLEEEGHTVQTHTLDVSSAASVSAFASTVCEARGRVEAIVHTAGVSPAMASAKKVLEVDLLGTALVIDYLGALLDSGGSMVCIASMGGYMLPSSLPTETETHFATAPTGELLDHASLREAIAGDDAQRGLAYSLAKRANQLRVQAAAPVFGQRGRCRINSVSPGVIHTAMLAQEMADQGGGELVRRFAETSAMGRFGTAADVVNAVAFLLSPESSFVTGTDLLCDGGSVASQRWGGAGSEYDGSEYDQRRRERDQ